ncbi:MAG: hypothetical protein A3I78_11570 [Gammaproteobacteria bacterium RIFCSPLOWO2_02_FULL_56_15]|nr:MAG: hypothetical protein A3I78_11570 [Gammaproteobacteria bacterium RIFCSPLOWO2_02_FULL_56_15]
MSGTDFPGRHAVAGEGQRFIRDRISLIPGPSPGGRREIFQSACSRLYKSLAFRRGLFKVDSLIYRMTDTEFVCEEE